MKRKYSERQYKKYCDYIKKIDQSSIQDGTETFLAMQFWFIDECISNHTIEEMQHRMKEEFLGHRPTLRLID